MDTQIFVVSPQIRKFLGAFRNRKSTNLCCVPVRKSQILKFARKKAVFLIQIPTNTAAGRRLGVPDLQIVQSLLGLYSRKDVPFYILRKEIILLLQKFLNFESTCTS